MYIFQTDLISSDKTEDIKNNILEAISKSTLNSDDRNFNLNLDLEALNYIEEISDFKEFWRDTLKLEDLSTIEINNEEFKFNTPVKNNENEEEKNKMLSQNQSNYFLLIKIYATF